MGIQQVRALSLLALLAGVAVLGAGCTKTEVSEGDIKALGKEHNEQSYEDAMKKAGRGAELDEQKKMAAERGQGSR